MTHKLIATDRYIGKDVPDEIALPLILARIMKQHRVAESGCWEYTGYIHPKGYGMTMFKGKNWKTHRLVWVCLHGPIPEWPEAVVLHSCDNRKCINPAHLSCGTQSENIIDGVTKGRQFHRAKTHCPAGHDYAKWGRAVLTTDPRQSSPWRACVLCQRIAGRKRAGWPQWAWELPAQQLGKRPDFSNAKACEP
jgi:hypothetical protein